MRLFLDRCAILRNAHVKKRARNFAPWRAELLGQRLIVEPYSSSSSSELKRPAPARWRKFCKLALKFWTGETRRRAWLLTLFVALFIALQLAAQLSINVWNRSFFDALEGKNVDALWWAVIVLPALVVFSGLAVTGWGLED